MSAKSSVVSEAEAPRTLIPVAIPGDFGGLLQDPDFVIYPLMPSAVVTLLGAHGGAGKTILALCLAAHVAAGQNWAGFTVRQGRALFVSLEDPGRVILDRLRRVTETYNLDPTAVAEHLAIVDGSAGDAALVAEHSDLGMRRLQPTATLEELQEIAKGFQLVIVDNASDAFDGDENSRRQVRSFIRLLGGIARENGAAVVLLAHIDKAAARAGSGGNSYSGSTAWHNSVRSRLALVENEGVVELRQEKLNLGKSANATALRWSANGVLEPLGGSQGAAEERTDMEAVLAAMWAAHTAGADVGAARTGPSTAQTTLSTFDELPHRLRGPRGRGGFWSAIGRLLSDGTLEARDVRGSNRHVRKCLVIRQAFVVSSERAR